MGCGGRILTSMGVERVTVGELRLRGRRTWGSWRWLLEALEVEEEEEEGVAGGARAEAPSEAGVEADDVAAAVAAVAAAAAAAAEVLAPSSVSCQ